MWFGVCDWSRSDCRYVSFRSRHPCPAASSVVRGRRLVPLRRSVGRPRLFQGHGRYVSLRSRRQRRGPGYNRGRDARGLTRTGAQCARSELRSAAATVNVRTQEAIEVLAVCLYHKETLILESHKLFLSIALNFKAQCGEFRRNLGITSSCTVFHAHLRAKI